MNTELKQASWVLKEKIAQRRSWTLFRLDWDVWVKTDKIIQNPTLSKKPVEIPPSKSKKTTEEILNELLELWKEIDTLTKMPINLAEKHWVTQEVASQVLYAIEDLKDDEYQKKELLDFLDQWKCVNLFLKWFEYFKVLKVCSTDAWNDIFVVSFKPNWWKKSPAQRLIIKFEFPIRKWSYLQLYDANSQNKLWRFVVESLELHKKSIIDRVLTIWKS